MVSQETWFDNEVGHWCLTGIGSDQDKLRGMEDCYHDQEYFLEISNPVQTNNFKAV